MNYYLITWKTSKLDIFSTWKEVQKHASKLAIKGDTYTIIKGRDLTVSADSLSNIRKSVV